MGQGGYIALVNGTPYDWTRTDQHSYQMHWDFPERVRAGTTENVYVEWDQGVFTTVADDAGDATYHLEGTPYTFEVRASAAGDFNLAIALLNLDTAEMASGGTRPRVEARRHSSLLALRQCREPDDGRGGVAGRHGDAHDEKSG